MYLPWRDILYIQSLWADDGMEVRLLEGSSIYFVKTHTMVKNSCEKYAEPEETSSVFLFCEWSTVGQRLNFLRPIIYRYMVQLLIFWKLISLYLSKPWWKSENLCLVKPRWAPAVVFSDGVWGGGRADTFVSSCPAHTDWSIYLPSGAENAVSVSDAIFVPAGWEPVSFNACNGSPLWEGHIVAPT